MKSRAKFCLALLLSCLSMNGFAWNALGHMVVANIAYQHLNPIARQKVDLLVKAMHTEYPNITSFAQLAAWPDAIRGQHIEAFTRWHYIDVAIGDTKTPSDKFVESDNILWALNKIPAILQYQKGNIYEQARFLAFLAHLTGDVHQPLHTVTRVSAEHPEGDHGGNLYLLANPKDLSPEVVRTLSLHHLWDTGCGAFNGDSSMDKVDQITQYITSLYPEESFGEAAHDPQNHNWAKEGMALAVSNVYATPENQPPTKIYLSAGKKLAQQRAALAGYRLAFMLNSYFNE